MIHVEKKLVVNVSKEKVWEVLKDFGSVEKFAATIEKSPVISDQKIGLGARRKCYFNDGSNLVEEIVDYQDGRGFTMQLSEFSLPLKSMSAQMMVEEIDAHRSLVVMSSDFVVKGGGIGQIMGNLLMKPMMSGVFKNLIVGLAYYSATSKPIGKKMPNKKDLSGFVEV